MGGNQVFNMLIESLGNNKYSCIYNGIIYADETEYETKYEIRYGSYQIWTEKHDGRLEIIKRISNNTFKCEPSKTFWTKFKNYLNR